MKYVSGKIITKKGFKKGYLSFESDKIIEIGNGLPPKKPIKKGIIIPTFVNSHTHIGDSFIRDKKIDLPRDIKKLVGPPNGLKHEFLKKTSDKKLKKGIKKSMKIMLKTGTKIFYDFREGGIKGIDNLKNASEECSIKPFILSRPNNLSYNKNEIELLLKKSEGIGISSITDWNYSELEKIARHTKRKKKIFSLHASERIRENIDKIIDLKPDFLVHMIKASQADLEIVKDNGIPIVLCPRSNFFFNLKPNISLMKKIGVDLLFGTDNAMLHSPNIIEEIRFILENYNDFSLYELLYFSTSKVRKVLNLDVDILSPDSKAEFVVLDEKSLKPIYVSYLS